MVSASGVFGISVATATLVWLPQNVLFLRRLRKIVITVQNRPGGAPKTTTWRLQDTVLEGKEVKHLMVDDNKLATYLFTRYEATNLPVEEKRDGVRKSEVVLAFPKIQ
jgi:hypothetical protein